MLKLYDRQMKKRSSKIKDSDIINPICDRIVKSHHHTEENVVNNRYRETNNATVEVENPVQANVIDNNNEHQGTAETLEQVVETSINPIETPVEQVSDVEGDSSNRTSIVNKNVGEEEQAQRIDEKRFFDEKNKYLQGLPLNVSLSEEVKANAYSNEIELKYNNIDDSLPMTSSEEIQAALDKNEKMIEEYYNSQTPRTVDDDINTSPEIEETSFSQEVFDGLSDDIKSFLDGDSLNSETFGVEESVQTTSGQEDDTPLYNLLSEDGKDKYINEKRLSTIIKCKAALSYLKKTNKKLKNNRNIYVNECLNSSKDYYERLIENLNDVKIRNKKNIEKMVPEDIGGKLQEDLWKILDNTDLSDELKDGIIKEGAKKVKYAYESYKKMNNAIESMPVDTYSSYSNENQTTEGESNIVKEFRFSEEPPKIRLFDPEETDSEETDSKKMLHKNKTRLKNLTRLYMKKFKKKEDTAGTIDIQTEKKETIPQASESAKEVDATWNYYKSSKKNKLVNELASSIVGDRARAAGLGDKDDITLVCEKRVNEGNWFKYLDKIEEEPKSVVDKRIRRIEQSYLDAGKNSRHLSLQLHEAANLSIKRSNTM